MSSSPITPTTRKVFYQEWRVPIVIIVLVFVGLIVTTWSTRGLIVGAAMLIFLGVSSIPKILCDALYSRVIVTDDGIDFWRIGYRIHTTWDNIEHMTYAQIGYSKGDILILREPRASVNKRLASIWNEARRLERDKEFAPLGKVMPLYFLDPTWRTGALGQEIRRYAPHLFVEYEK